MSLIAWLLETTGSFDKVRKGGYDLGSACGFVQECEDVKDCINSVCVPISDIYGGEIYANCVSYCNYDNNMESIGDLFCENPKQAYEIYGYECEGYDPLIGNTISLFGFNITYIQAGSFLMFLLIIYIIYARLG